jgi:hypothetical protein
MGGGCVAEAEEHEKSLVFIWTAGESSEGGTRYVASMA